MLAYRSLNEIKSARTRAAGNVGLTKFLGLMLQGICVSFECGFSFLFCFFLFLISLDQSDWLTKRSHLVNDSDLKIYVSLFLFFLLRFNYNIKNLSFLSSKLHRRYVEFFENDIFAFHSVDFHIYIYIYVFLIYSIHKEERSYSYFYQKINHVIFAPP